MEQIWNEMNSLLESFFEEAEEIIERMKERERTC